MNAMPMMNMGGMMPQMMPMMSGMNMMPMMMPMMPMMMGMTCEMSGKEMVCKMTPMGNMTMEMMKECCERMNSMMKMGMPVMMMCGGMMYMCSMPEHKGK